LRDFYGTKYPEKIRAEAIALLKIFKAEIVYVKMNKSVPLETLRRWRWTKVPTNERPLIFK